MNLISASLALPSTGGADRRIVAGRASAAEGSGKHRVEAAVDSVRGSLGLVNVLFNHAGTIVIKPFLETEEEDWDFLFDVNVKSMYLMTRAVLPMMLEQGKGAIVCTSSISAVYATQNEALYDVVATDSAPVGGFRLAGRGPTSELDSSQLVTRSAG